MIIKKVINYNIEEGIGESISKHLPELKALFIVFAINLLIYGQKIFYSSLPADDYMRFYGDDNTQLLITNSARWAQALLNEYVFAGELQILPYLHGVIGIFSFSLMGLLTAKYFNRTTTFEMIVISLLVSATPMFAHNLFFSTNITTWITLCLGLIGFLLLYREGILIKIFAFLLLIISIGNYQTIVQIVAALLLFDAILKIMAIKSSSELKAIFIDAFVKLLLVLVAYIVSYYINEQFLKYHHWEAVHRLAKATSETGFTVFVDRLKNLYQDSVHFDHFGVQFYRLYGAMAILAIVGTLYRVFRNSIPTKSKILSTTLVVLLFASIPIVVNLPALMGLDIPPRAHFTIGWVLAGLFVLHLITLKGLLKSLSTLVALSIIILSTYYITLFFDAGIRQTKSDILRANTIVERIRNHKNYTKEPIGFHIVGGQKFNVLGWDLKFEQPFSTHWAKYKIFKYFTDLNFHPMRDYQLNRIEQYIIDAGEKVYPYPGKNSVVVHNGNAVVFLNTGSINNAIIKSKYLDKFPSDKKADINATFNIYLKDNLIFYEKKNCKESDIRQKFFLRLYRDKALPNIVERLDFFFANSGEMENGRCVAVSELPKGKIWRIWTGQFGQGKIYWETNYYDKEDK